MTATPNREMPPVTETADDAVTPVRDFAAAHEATFESAYTRWSPLVYTFALRSLGRVADAEDVTCDVFLEGWRDADAVDDPSALPSWLIDIARARVEHFRSVREAHQGVPVEVPPGDAFLGDHLIVADQIASLEPEAQRAIRLALADGLSHQQIAARLRLPRGTVKHHLQTGLDRLRGGNAEDDATWVSPPHADRDELAVKALGEPTFSKLDRAHLASCEQCATYLRELTAAVKEGRRAISVSILVRPSARVWDAIAAELHAPQPEPAAGDKAPRMSGRRFLVTVAIALVIAIIIVVGGILGWNALAPQ